MMNLNELKTTELKQLGKKFQLKGWWNMKKDDLVSTIEKIVSASDEALEVINEYEKEKAALIHYDANWRKYTQRYNTDEFLKKWKAGKIVLENETTNEEPVETPESRSEDTSDAEHRNIQDEPENAIENESEAPECESDEEIKVSQKPAPKPKRGALIEFNGKAQNIVAWGKELGISANTLYGRLYKLGWSVEKAFTKK